MRMPGPSLRAGNKVLGQPMSKMSTRRAPYRSKEQNLIGWRYIIEAWRRSASITLHPKHPSPHKTNVPQYSTCAMGRKGPARSAALGKLGIAESSEACRN